jgi:hypothetical protein
MNVVVFALVYALIMYYVALGARSSRGDIITTESVKWMQ